MVIKKQPILSWLLGGNNTDFIGKLGIAGTHNSTHLEYLNNSFKFLADVQKSTPNWGLPQLILPPFEEAMKKNIKSYYQIDHQLFQEFYKNGESGIVISKHWGTIAYGFGENTLHIWLFQTHNNESCLYLYCYIISTKDNTRQIYTYPTLINDEELFFGDINERQHIYEYLTNYLISFLTLKKYCKVEVIEIPTGTIAKIDNEVLPLKDSGKIRNDSGQKVIVMDSRWFRKIVNNNNIQVRSFYRNQNKKNANGEWYKEKILVKSFIRHGYHRNAKIEN